MPIIPELMRWKQEDQKLEIIHGYIEWPTQATEPILSLPRIKMHCIHYQNLKEWILKYIFKKENSLKTDYSLMEEFIKVLFKIYYYHLSDSYILIKYWRKHIFKKLWVYILILKYLAFRT